MSRNSFTGAGPLRQNPMAAPVAIAIQAHQAPAAPVALPLLGEDALYRLAALEGPKPLVETSGSALVSRDVTRTDSGSITSLSFEDGSSLTITRERTDGGYSVTYTSIDSDGGVSVGIVRVQQLDDGRLLKQVTDADGTQTSTLLDADAGTRTIQIVEADGDTTIVTSAVAADGTLAGTILLEADGSSSGLDFTLLNEKGDQTLTVAGTLADGTMIDSSVAWDHQTGTVMVTDQQGDIATFTIAAFQQQVTELGLIGVIADVDTGLFG